MPRFVKQNQEETINSCYGIWFVFQPVLFSSQFFLGSSIEDRLEELEKAVQGLSERNNALEKAVQRNSLTGSVWFDAFR